MLKRYIGYILVTVIAVVAVVISAVDKMVTVATKGQLYSDVARVPKNKVGLLLGTSKYKDKARHIINPYYQNRIDAAVELYMAGKIDYIIVSGDNSSVYYNEPELMRNDLIAQGVPAKKIILDNAGFRTLDSVLRCRDIFGQTSVTIISQEFHNKRAVYIANHKEIAAVAFNAADGDAYWTIQWREKMARIKMMIDLVVDKKAKIYGAPLPIK